MTENERIREVRKAKRLTLEEFGAKIGIQKSAVSKIERGERSVTDLVRRSVCHECNVNETWLRTGEGEMFVAAPSDELDALAKRYHFRHKDYVLIEKLVNLSLEDRDTVFRFMQEVVAGATDCGADPDAPVFPDGFSEPKPPQEMTREEIHMELDRQLDEEKKQAERGSVSGPGNSEKATG